MCFGRGWARPGKWLKTVVMTISRKEEGKIDGEKNKNKKETKEKREKKRKKGRYVSSRRKMSIS